MIIYSKLERENGKLKNVKNWVWVTTNSGTSAWFWLGGQCPLAAWGKENFENLTTKWCILKYIWINMWSASRRFLHLPALIALKIQQINIACFRFLIFHPFFQGRGVSWPFAICPYVRTPMDKLWREVIYSRLIVELYCFAWYMLSRDSTWRYSMQVYIRRGTVFTAACLLVDLCSCFVR